MSHDNPKREADKSKSEARCDQPETHLSSMAGEAAPVSAEAQAKALADKLVPHDDDCGVGSGFCRCRNRGARVEIQAALTSYAESRVKEALDELVGISEPAALRAQVAELTAENEGFVIEHATLVRESAKAFDARDAAQKEARELRAGVEKLVEALADAIRNTEGHPVSIKVEQVRKWRSALASAAEVLSKGGRG